MRGALPSQIMQELIEQGQIITETPTKETQIQPASMDLTLGKKAYRVRGSFLPSKDEKVKELIDALKIYEFDISEEGILEKDAVYVIELNESLKLDSEIFAHTNNKSSTGRLNLITRTISDGCEHYDRVRKGYRGKLYLKVISKSFIIKVHEGDSLNQIRFFTGDSRLTDEEFREEYRKQALCYNKNLKKMSLSELSVNNGIVLTVDLSERIAGWRAKCTNEIIDLSKKAEYNPSDFFEEVMPKDKQLVLKEGEFYIFNTNERVSFPPKFAGQMVPFDATIGEFRTHDAGFFDPGFGHGRNGELKGAQGVLEVRPYGNNIILRHGQPICKLVYERVSEIPELVYGADTSLSSHYHGQTGPRLSKHFKEI